MTIKSLGFGFLALAVIFTPTIYGAAPTTSHTEEQSIFRFAASDRVRRGLIERFGEDPIPSAAINAELEYVIDDKWVVIVMATIRGLREFDANGRWIKGTLVTATFEKTVEVREHVFQASGVISIESSSKKATIPFTVILQPINSLVKGNTPVTGQICWGQIEDAKR